MTDDAPVVQEIDESQLDEKALARLQKKKEKAALKAAKKAKKEALRNPQREVILVQERSAFQFGDLPLVQSQEEDSIEWTDLINLTPELADQNVWLRVRLETVRAKGKVAFLVVRQQSRTAQVSMFTSDEVPKEMIKYAGKIPPESIVDIYGKVVLAKEPIESTTQKLVEIQALKLYVVSASAPVLPLQISDASTPLAEDLGTVEEKPADDDKMATVSREVRLNYRFVDLRTAANQAIFRIQSAVGQYFRQFFIEKGFVEVHSPKIIGAASEGGSEVFGLEYFGRPAFLAQSPQLYKQMCICSDFGGVFEVGPVFRAENSNTNRHLCEFVGLDFEMEIKSHYHEVLLTLSDLFKFIFDKLNKHNAYEQEVIRRQYPSEPLQYLEETLVLHFPDAIQMLHEAGEISADPFGDLSTPHEKLLGTLVKKKYNTDFYIIDQYPSAARPFYTMPSPTDKRYSNSYDVFLRGEEITSGAQRIHDPELLIKRAGEQDPPIPIETIQDYVDSFKYGAMPHGGAGIGLERVVMLFLGLRNIRLTSMYPRDPKRCAP